MDKSGKAVQVTRRPYRNTEITMPLLGFGLMRLPQKDGNVDYATSEKMVQMAMDAGCNYFDTAYMYLRGESEKFVGKVLSKFPRDKYFLTSKMPIAMMNSEADNERIFKEQLERTKAGYFDFYFLHWLNEAHWEKAQRLKTLDFMKKMKAEGKIRRIGFSFHGGPEVLEKIAKSYPWELAQIQLNYLDWTLYRSKEQYEILTKLGIPVVVMEPLRGGALANLNDEATRVFKAADPDASPASWAFRFAGSLPNVICVLSGMTKMEHLEDNIRTFTDFKPLDDKERATIEAALAAYRKTGAIPCTACRYCTPCPVGVDIPRIFGLYNHYKVTGNYMQFRMIYDKLTEDERASACIGCGTCLKKCPQKINIPEELKKIDAELKRPPRRRRAMSRTSDAEELA